MSMINDGMRDWVANPDDPDRVACRGRIEMTAREMAELEIARAEASQAARFTWRGTGFWPIDQYERFPALMLARWILEQETNGEVGV